MSPASLLARAVGVALSLALACAAGKAMASEYSDALDALAADYRAGLAFTADPDYKSLYAKTSSREVTFSDIRELPGRHLVAAQYDTVITTADGEERRQHGGVVAHLTASIPASVDAIEWAVGRPGVGAATGQAADVVTTAASLAAGAVEANPLVAGGIAAGPGGIIVLVVAKTVMLPAFARSRPYAECVADMGAIGGGGWALAAGNIGMFVNPVLGLAAGGIAYNRGGAAARETAAIDCLPPAEPPALADASAP